MTHGYFFDPAGEHPSAMERRVAYVINAGHPDNVGTDLADYGVDKEMVGAAFLFGLAEDAATIIHNAVSTGSGMSGHERCAEAMVDRFKYLHE